MSEPEIVVWPHQPGWAADFERIARRVSHLLGLGPEDVHHFGSTAVSGLSAKPIIDVLVIVPPELLPVEPRLTGLGWTSRGEFGIPGRSYFTSPGLHVHIYPREHPEIPRHLALRDYLRRHPAEAVAYGRLKAELAAVHATDRAGYQTAKGPYVAALEARALQEFGDRP